MVFFEAIPGHDPPVWRENGATNEGIVYSPHWYDLKAIFSKVRWILFMFYESFINLSSRLMALLHMTCKD
jgi:hypothetical protein